MIIIDDENMDIPQDNNPPTEEQEQKGKAKPRLFKDGDEPKAKEKKVAPRKSFWNTAKRRLSRKSMMGSIFGKKSIFKKFKPPKQLVIDLYHLYQETDSDSDQTDSLKDSKQKESMVSRKSERRSSESEEGDDMLEFELDGKKKDPESGERKKRPRRKRKRRKPNVFMITVTLAFFIITILVATILIHGSNCTNKLFCFSVRRTPLPLTPVAIIYRRETDDPRENGAIDRVCRVIYEFVEEWSYSWTYYDSSVLKTVEGPSLKLPITLSTKGPISCSAKSSEGIIANISFDFPEAGKPFVYIVRGKEDLRFGGYVNRSCKIFPNKPEWTIKWILPQDRTQDGIVMTIPKITNRDIGLYKCLAKGKSGTTSPSTFVLRRPFSQTLT